MKARTISIAAAALLSASAVATAQTYGPPGSAIPNPVAPPPYATPPAAAPLLPDRPYYSGRSIQREVTPPPSGNEDWRVQRGNNDWRADDWRAREERAKERAARQREGGWRVRQEDRSTASSSEKQQSQNQSKPCPPGTPADQQTKCSPPNEKAAPAGDQGGK